MREILFRGKDVETGEWRYGSFLELPDGWTTTYWGRYTRDHRFFIIVIENNESKRFEIDHNTVGQYTGLRDKNGVKIFEGDVLKVADTITCLDQPLNELEVLQFTGVLEWDNEGADYQIVGKDYIRGFGLEDAIYEVIGNIHDNPELLEAE